MANFGFNYKCPLCGEIGWYEMPMNGHIRKTIDRDALLSGRCEHCKMTWAKYADYVFGSDADCLKSVKT